MEPVMPYLTSHVLMSRVARRARPSLESLESRALLSILTDPAPTVTQLDDVTYLFKKELYGYNNYGSADSAADVLYSRESGSWTYDLSSLLASRRVVSAEFSISGVLDDHYELSAGYYFGTISTNGVTQ